MTPPPDILVVDDDEIDVLNVRRALKHLGIAGEIGVASDGIEALAVVRSQPAKTRPQLVLLDLNMPRMNGIEFLREIRRSDELKSLHVVVLTTSDDPEDIREAYDLNVAGYVLKPLEYRDFVGAMQTITDFWMLIETPGSVAR